MQIEKVREEEGVMNPLLTRSLDGQYRCHGCKKWLKMGTDAEEHARAVHRVAPDFIAIDEVGDIFDLRGIDLPQYLRGKAAI